VVSDRFVLAIDGFAAGDGGAEDEGMAVGDGSEVGDGMTVGDGVRLGEGVAIGRPGSSSSQADAVRNRIASAAFLNSFLRRECVAASDSSGPRSAARCA
jgi:hypothetical protein